MKGSGLPGVIHRGEGKTGIRASPGRVESWAQEPELPGLGHLLVNSTVLRLDSSDFRVAKSNGLFATLVLLSQPSSWREHSLETLSSLASRTLCAWGFCQILGTPLSPVSSAKCCSLAQGPF